MHILLLIILLLTCYYIMSLILDRVILLREVPFKVYSFTYVSETFVQSATEERSRQMVHC